MTSSRSEGFWSANSALGRGYYSYSSSSSSSPPWSSSPPTSPSSSIHPRIAPSSSDSSSRKSSFQWPSHLTTMKSTPVKGPCKLPSFKAMFGDIAPSSSDAESSKGAEHVKSIQELESVFYSDSEEEDENDVGLEDSWTGSTSRTTYFQTSDERGRWHELPPSFRQRHSEPTTTRPLPPSPTKRNLSEPAPLSIPSFTEESSELSYDADLESEPITSDGGVMSSSSPELRPFSSLPPSSPPFSPRSSPTSPDLAPLSPLSSPLSEIMTMSPSIPALSLSPLSAMSPLSSDNDEDVEEMAMQITQALPSSLSPVAPDDPTDNARSIEAPTSPPHSTSNLPWTTPSPPEPRESPITCDAKLPAAIEESDFSVPGSGVIVEPLAIAVKAEIEQPIQSDDVTVFSVKENDAKRKPSEEPSPSPSLPRKKLRTAGPSKPKQGDENSAIPPKRRTRKAPPPLHTAPAKKPAPRRRRRASSFSSSSSSDSDSDDEAAAPPPAPIPKIVLNTEDMEIFGMIIETMATSRASSLSATSLFKSVMTTRPGLQREWNAEKFVRVLQDAHQQNGVFGKVDSSGMDDSDRPLEAKWFYVPERDEDQDRAALVRSMMPRPAKRTETKKYKQYYYRPLGKISRWDDEDAL